MARLRRWLSELGPQQEEVGIENAAATVASSASVPRQRPAGLYGARPRRGDSRAEAGSEIMTCFAISSVNWVMQCF